MQTPQSSFHMSESILVLESGPQRPQLWPGSHIPAEAFSSLQESRGEQGPGLAKGPSEGHSQRAGRKIVIGPRASPPVSSFYRVYIRIV